MTLSHHNNFKAIIFMLLHALSGAILFTVVKTLSKDISSSMVVFLYKLSLLFMILPWVLKNGFASLKTTRIKTYIIGGIFGTSATLCLMHGIKYIPLANATALGYLEKILLIMVGIFYFREKISKDKIIAIILSFVGAMIVVFPRLNLQGYNPYYCFIFASIILWVAHCLAIKSLGKTENVKTQTFYTIFLSTLLSFPIAFINWQDGSFIDFESIGLELKHLPLIISTAICYLVLSISAFKSFQCGDLAVISPFGYSKIIFAGLLGAALFNEHPSISNYIGYIIIALSSWYLAKAAHRNN